MSKRSQRAAQAATTTTTAPPAAGAAAAGQARQQQAAARERVQPAQQQQQVGESVTASNKSPPNDNKPSNENENELLSQQLRKRARQQVVGDASIRTTDGDSQQPFKKGACEQSSALPEQTVKATLAASARAPHQQKAELAQQNQNQTSRACATSEYVCAACARPIRERYLLMALDKHWHEDCLKCACCDCRLGEVGSSLFTHSDKLLCRRDFLRIFGQPGHCAACKRSIPPYELVMRANELAYHMDCFACQQCQYRFCVGDSFHLVDTYKILCPQCHAEQQQQLLIAQQEGVPGQQQAQQQRIQLPARQDTSEAASASAANGGAENADAPTTIAPSAEILVELSAGEIERASGTPPPLPLRPTGGACEERSCTPVAAALNGSSGGGGGGGGKPAKARASVVA